MKNRIIIAFLSIILVLTILFFNRTIDGYNIPFYRDGEYYIREIQNFLSDEECDRIRQISDPKLFKSRVYTSNSDVEDSQVRISDQCWLKDDDDEFIAKLSHRIASVTGTDLKSQEELQVVRYKSGGFYKPHYDACNKETDDCTRLNKGLGPRFMTFIIYLNDDFEGGETLFPQIGAAVVPKKGKAAIFYNVDNEGEVLPKSLHGGLDVRNGEKWICNKWIRLTRLASA